MKYVVLFIFNTPGGSAVMHSIEFNKIEDAIDAQKQYHRQMTNGLGVAMVFVKS